MKMHQMNLVTVADSWRGGAVRVQDEEQEPTMAKCRNRGEEKITLILKIGSVYHVRNNACIHLRAKCLNIYMYRRGENIQRTPWRNTIIEKTNTYLIKGIGRYRLSPYFNYFVFNFLTFKFQ
jgi:hypothetical protein